MLINNKSMITITENNSTLKNKKGCYIGDSYSVPEVYQNYLRNEFGVLEGYAGVLNTIGDKKLYNNGWSVRAIVDKIISCTLDDTADFVVIMAGTNDAHYAIANTYEGYEEVGTIDDDISDYKNTSPKTFCMDLKKLFELTLKKYSGKPIIYVIQPVRKDSLASQGINERLETQNNLAKQICNMYSIKYIDLFHEYSSGIILADGIHPDTNSYKKIGRLIGKQLDSMMI